jgi:hypothetical protein
MPEMTPIPPGLRVEDTCDYCHRGFARTRGAKAVCPSCGLENDRIDTSLRPSESNMLPGGPERAVLPTPKPKPRRQRK